MSMKGRSEDTSIKKQETQNTGKPKIDIAKLVSIIPPASELRKKEEKVREKRIRIKWDETLPKGIAKLSKSLADLLGIKEGDFVEIVVAGRHRFLFKATIISEGNINEVYCNPEELKEKGVADNSIATLRKSLKGV